ncbi:MAG: hypothetical protein EA398_15795 [Deltaproteobacteria bacterium]|nr:MAG: hypothetical protein EA398_15795 [Deltaproteobacteria bacterium]
MCDSGQSALPIRVYIDLSPPGVPIHGRGTTRGKMPMDLRFTTLLIVMSCLSWVACSTSGLAPDSRQRVVIESGVAQAERVPAAVEAAAEDEWLPVPLASVDPLGEQEVAQLLSRIPEMEPDVADTTPFLGRPVGRTVAPAGETIEAPWPAAPVPAAQSPAPSGPLEVISSRPEGEAVPPFQIALSFDRPMIAVGSVADAPVPDIVMVPLVPGRWRWLGSRTLAFQPDDPIPLATEFTVELGAGLQAPDGEVLQEPFRFTFATPAPRVSRVYPSDGIHDTDQPVFVVFDQRAHLRMARQIVVTDANGTVPMRVVAVEPADLLELGGVERERVLKLEPARPYSSDYEVEVRVNEPILSLDGDRRGEVGTSGRFRVRGPLRLLGIRCRWEQCSPRSTVQVQLSNDLRPDQDLASLVTVTPEVEQLRVLVRGDTIRLQGSFQPRTTYRVAVSRHLEDVFGQSVAGDHIEDSVSIGEGESQWVTPENRMIVFPSDQRPLLPVEVTALQRFSYGIHRVALEPWDEFIERVDCVLGREGECDGVSPVDTGELTFSPEEQQATRRIELDLSQSISIGSEPVMVHLVFPWYSGRHLSQWFWVQATDLAADITNDGQRMHVRVTSMRDGAPVVGATVSAGDSASITDDQGEARVDVTTTPVVVRHGADRLVVPPNGRPDDRISRWWTRDPAVEALWGVLTDREMYRPGETMHLRGWVRQRLLVPAGDLELLPDRQVRYRIVDPRGNELDAGSVDVDGFGSFGLTFQVPDDVNLGRTRVHLSVEDHETQHSFQVREFRTPEYEIRVDADQGPHVAGDTIRFTALASYHAGGPLRSAPARWSVTEHEATFRPPGWSQFTFGGGHLWPRRALLPSDSSSGPAGAPQPTQRADVRLTTDASGRSTLRLPLDPDQHDSARRVVATVSVEDVNRQRWAASTERLVHPAEVYVGLRPSIPFAAPNEPVAVDVVAVDIDGRVVAGRPMVVEQRTHHGRDGDEEVLGSCEVLSTDGPVRCQFRGIDHPAFELVARVTDARGRRNTSRRVVWGAGWSVTSAMAVREDELALVPDQETYSVGDVARLVVHSPVYPLDAVIELRQNGVLERRIQRITADVPLIELALTEDAIPNVHVAVLGTHAGSDHVPGRFASGTVDISVDPAPHRLSVDVLAQPSRAQPGEPVEIEVRVSNAEGESVPRAQVVLFAVDEAVLGLSDYQLIDLVSRFFPRRAAQIQQVRSRRWLLAPLAPFAPDVEEAEEEEDPDADGSSLDRASPSALDTGAGAAFGREVDASGPSPVALRELLHALVFFRADLESDEDGRVVVTERLPDSLTRYRVMALAVDGPRRFGGGESSVTARLPLSVRPSPPRFLNVGDTLEFPVVLQNRTDEGMVVDVGVQVSAALELTGHAGLRVRVPADDRVEVRFPLSALRAGTARVHVVASSGQADDAVLASIPVLTPASTETFATYGSLAETSVVLQQVHVPEAVQTRFGGLDIQLSSTQLQILTDAFLYLVNYPFDCSEQIASRILGVLALHPVLEAFDVPGLPPAEELRATLDVWVTRLARHQRSNGGFGFWERGGRISPFVSVHAIHALLLAANQPELDVPESAVTNGMRYLERIRTHVLNANMDPGTYASIEAYALSVRARFAEVAQLRELEQFMGRHDVDDLSVEAMGWLLPVARGTAWESRLEQRLLGRARETAATAEFQESLGDTAWQILHTARRADAIALDGLLQTQPEHPLVSKLVRGLLAHRSQGRWGNTQENVFILLALRRYLETHEPEAPRFVARAWLDDAQVAEHPFGERSTERHVTRVPMHHLHEGASVQRVVLQRDGSGRMYYRLGLRYAPLNHDLAALSQGFTVSRSYVGMDDEDAVRRTEDGWEIEAGARVRVELTMTLTGRRTHVALLDWLPAGLEPIDTALAVSERDAALSPLAGSSTPGAWWWGGRWFEHENLRDERVEAFSSLLPRGAYRYSYIARATTPGTFVAMPARAEEMYHPETFGRSGTDVVRVVERRP